MTGFLQARGVTILADPVTMLRMQLWPQIPKALYPQAASSLSLAEQTDLRNNCSRRYGAGLGHPLTGQNYP